MKTKIVSVQFYHVHQIIEDMLRYDCAFACDKFPNVVAYPKFTFRNGTWGGKPTIERWRSFLAGIDPTPFIDQQFNIITFEQQKDEWYTIDDDKESLSERLPKLTQRDVRLAAACLA